MNKKNMIKILMLKIKKIYNNRAYSDFTKNIVSLASGSAIAQIISVTASPILSRLFGPKFFGITAVYTSILTIGCVIGALRLDAAIMVPKSDDESRGLYQLSCLTTIIFSSIVFISLSILYVFNLKIINVSNHIIIVIILAIHIFVNNFNTALNIWANRKNKFFLLFYYPILSQSIAVGINLLLGIIGFKEYGLIIGSFIGYLFGGIYLAYRVAPPIIFLGLKKYKELFCKYKNFAIYQMPGLLLNTASMQVQVILISLFFGATVVGGFSLCQSILNLPMAVIGQSIGQAFYKKTTELVHENQPLDSLTWDMIKKTLILFFLPLAIVMVFADKVFVLIFGSQWSQAGYFARYLAPWLFFVFLSSILTSALFALSKQKDYMFINIVTFVSRIIPIIGGGLLSINPYMAIAILSGTGTIVSFIICCYILQVCNVKIYEFIKLVIINCVFVLFPLYILRLLLFKSIF